ncbi:MAG TPA: hypothetical protein VGH93_02930, partial [Solirubrobacteraceae bacterium]
MKGITTLDFDEMIGPNEGDHGLDPRESVLRVAKERAGARRCRAFVRPAVTRRQQLPARSSGAPNAASG